MKKLFFIIIFLNINLLYGQDSIPKSNTNIPKISKKGSKKLEPHKNKPQKPKKITPVKVLEIKNESDTAALLSENTKVKESPKNVQSRADFWKDLKIFKKKYKTDILVFLAFWLGLGSLYWLIKRVKFKKTTNNMKPKIIEQNTILNPIEKPVVSNDLSTRLEPKIQNAFFVSDILMTAGPRKKNLSDLSDVDLGEDVCSFITKNNAAFLCLLDGTSDFYCLKYPDSNQEYFSSRLLAQKMAWEIKNRKLSQNNFEMVSAINESIDAVMKFFVDVLRKLPKKVQESLVKQIETKNFPECACTILIAELHLNGDLTVYRSGDSNLLIRHENQTVDLVLSHKNTLSNDRLFFRMFINPLGELDIVRNQNQKFECIERHNVAEIIAYSDGVGQLTQQYLARNLAQNSKDIKAEIMNHIQGTADDKAICFIEIIKSYEDESNN